MKEIMKITNIDGMQCYEKDGTAYLNLETVARGLGFTQTAASGNEVVRWERVNKYLNELGVPISGDKFIPENIFYRLAMKAKNATAEAFQAKVADEIIPAIRKTGGYVADADTFLSSYLPYADEQSKLMFKAQLGIITNLNHKIEDQHTKNLFAV
jgi:prophage antirepressor-like protein